MADRLPFPFANLDDLQAQADQALREGKPGASFLGYLVRYFRTAQTGRPIGRDTETTAPSQRPEDAGGAAAPKPEFATGSDALSTPTPPTPTHAAATATVPQPDAGEPEPAKIVSDILPPLSTPARTPDTQITPSQPKSGAASDSARKPKYATDEERRKATSLALKREYRCPDLSNKPSRIMHVAMHHAAHGVAC